MSRKGRARRSLIASLCPRDALVVDVGADHGMVAASLPRAIATEHQPHLAGGRGLRWVVADGLAPFREVEVAVIAGMGARLIASILERGPRPEVAVLHATDEPQWLRSWLAGHGWRIDAEGLAPEAGRHAEVIRAVPGHEAADGARLELGPRLIEGPDPLLGAHLSQLVPRLRRILAQVGPHAPERTAVLQARVDLAVEILATLPHHGQPAGPGVS